MRRIISWVLLSTFIALAMPAFAWESDELNMEAVDVIDKGDYTQLSVKLSGKYWNYFTTPGDLTSENRLSQMESLFTAALLSGKRVKIKADSSSSIGFYGVKLVAW